MPPVCEKELFYSRVGFSVIRTDCQRAMRAFRFRRLPNQLYPEIEVNQIVFKHGSRRREEADFGAKNNSASLPRRRRLLRRFLNSSWQVNWVKAI